MTIAEFLLARITELSTRAHTACEAEADPTHAVRVIASKLVVNEFDAPFSIRWFMANQSPQHAIQDAQAKVRVLARHPGATAEDECPGCGADLSGRWNTGPGELCPELQDMALAYADHTDYREEWKP